MIKTPIARSDPVSPTGAVRCRGPGTCFRKLNQRWDDLYDAALGGSHNLGGTLQPIQRRD